MSGGPPSPLLRRVVRRTVPASARRVIRRRLLPLARRVHRRFAPPLVSVVVASRGAGDYLAECLASLARQTQPRVEIIVVEGGSPDGKTRVPPLTGWRYPRLRIIRSERQGIAQAHNLGARQARGKYLAFVDADDTLPPGALRTLVRSLELSGSDFAIGAVHRVRLGRVSRPAWHSQVHELDRAAVTINEFPAAMQDVAPFNRLYRRTFWTEKVGGYVEDSDYGDSLIQVTSFTRAVAFDVLKAVTYQWQVRADPRSLVQERVDRQQLEDNLAMLERTWQILSAEASPAVAGAWLGGVFDAQLAPYLENASRADDAFRERLGRTIRTFVAIADEQVWAHVRVEQRLRVWLAARGQWRGLERCIEWFRLNGPIPVTSVEDGRIYAERPSLPDLSELPLDLLELPMRQTGLSACIARVRWRGDTLVLEGWAFIRGLDLTGVTPSLEAWLVDSTTGTRLPVVLRPRMAPEANRWANQRNQSVESSGFTAFLEVDQLPPQDADSLTQMWQLEFKVSAHGVQRTGAVRSLLRSGIAHRMPARELRDSQDPFRVVPVMDARLGFCVQQRTDRVRATDLHAGVDGRTGGRLSVLRQIPAPLASVRAVSAAGIVEAPLVLDRDGHAVFELGLPVGTGEQVDWTFRAVDQQGRSYRVCWPVEKQARRAIGGSGGGARWARSPRGYCDLATDFLAVEVSRVTVSDSALAVEATLVGLTADDLGEAVLRSGRATVAVQTVDSLGPNRARLQFPMSVSLWGNPDRPLPAGRYQLILPNREVTFRPAEELLADLPVEGTTRWHGFTVARRPSHTDLTLTLRAPLADDERGRFAQRRLAQWYDETDFRPTESVLFQCYRGEFATDSQRAIHEELHRQSHGLALLWGVSDYSVVLPEGALPLLIGSRAWYAAVASSRYLCQNIDFDRFFRHRPYQRYLQTFHGYPFKSMGISLWRAQGKSESVIDAECERRNSAWDALLVPSDPCVAMYRREYRYEGEILVTGYPRNDSLVSSDAEAVRLAVRERLGIAADKTVVLYAPTWRDTVATGAWTARLFDELDLDQLTEQLGDGYAVLLRGHNYNLRDGGTSASAAVLDVSSYPEINDLILAADVAILDYSSLRFDWLITEKPVLFFVPDLDDYLSARTVLFDYRSSAPGPLLKSTDEVIAALHGLPAVSRDFADARRTFNATFNGLHDGNAAKRVVNAFFD